MDQIKEEGLLSPPPPKKKKRKRGHKRSKNQSLTDDVDSLSSDEQEMKSLLITVDGRGSRDEGGRRAELTPQRQSLLGEYHSSPFGGSPNHHQYGPSSSHSNSPYQHTSSHSHQSPSHFMDSPPFPRTSHDFQQHHQQRQHLEHRPSSDYQRHQPPESGNEYSLDLSHQWRERNLDQDVPRRSSYGHNAPPLPLLPPPSTPPPPPIPPPSRSYSDFHQRHPPHFHRRYSEPVSNYDDPGYRNATPTSRRDRVTHDGKYLTSSRGFRVPYQRTREAGDSHYNSDRSRTAPHYDRRHSSGSGRY